MDKLGSSEEAKNKGHPGTSRDGAPIEMTALLKLGLDLLISLHSKNLYKYDGTIIIYHPFLSFRCDSLRKPEINFC